MRSTLALLSDTHGFIPEALFEHIKGLPVLHAGDIGTRQVLERLQARGPVHAVRGNVDGSEFYDLPMTLCLELAGKRIALIHNAGWPQRPHPAALDLVRKQQAEVLVYGHTHVCMVARHEETLWINPGAAGNLGHHEERSAALLHIEEDGTLSLERILLGARFSTR
ncbi:MAG: metallophosphoesterase family protein [Myxococcota bacterium]|jgi:putative phosphoesterase|nr:metallophosphoesterase family protein [Myxococcota bacterium]